ncbi:hypothetical protein EJ03DRAFT_186246 [Teratosphaeria nubilosa]|uniref:Uncharacterized protein n=1 Tax=Teratosphaeria nubilosa TaxID=161662 RepID=A0A6G1LHY6_9PEZI|nr:hypothetical protein EJ03DRAFT_186246 [Teratosphaeria nubilosa]
MGECQSDRHLSPAGFLHRLFLAPMIGPHCSHVRASFTLSPQPSFTGPLFGIPQMYHRNVSPACREIISTCGLSYRPLSREQCLCTTRTRLRSLVSVCRALFSRSSSCTGDRCVAVRRHLAQCGKTRLQHVRPLSLQRAGWSQRHAYRLDARALPLCRRLYFEQHSRGRRFHQPSMLERLLTSV